MPGQAVGSVGMGRVAEAVSRELVQQQHQRQGAFGGLQPVLAGAAGRGVVRFQEAAAELGIEVVITRKPPLRTGRTPELHYLFGCAHQSGFLSHLPQIATARVVKHAASNILPHPDLPSRSPSSGAERVQLNPPGYLLASGFKRGGEK